MCLTVIVTRPLWVLATALVSRSVLAVFGETVPTARPATPVLFVIGWAGMRGVISLAVALSLPEATSAGQPFPGRDLIVFITFAVILVTLIGQGLTLPVLVRRVGVGVLVGRLEDQEISARLRLARAALRELDIIGERTGAPPDAVERVRGVYADRIERLQRHHAVLVAFRMPLSSTIVWRVGFSTASTYPSRSATARAGPLVPNDTQPRPTCPCAAGYAPTSSTSPGSDDARSRQVARPRR